MAWPSLQFAHTNYFQSTIFQNILSGTDQHPHTLSPTLSSHS